MELDNGYGGNEIVLGHGLMVFCSHGAGKVEVIFHGRRPSWFLTGVRVTSLGLTMFSSVLYRIRVPLLSESLGPFKLVEEVTGKIMKTTVAVQQQTQQMQMYFFFFFL